MTQPELFEVKHVGNVILFETSRLAQGQQIKTGIIPRPPMPAPADSSVHIPDTGKKAWLTKLARTAIRNSGGDPDAGESALPPFARNSDTSRQAAIEKYEARNSENQREMIYRWIKFCGLKGATREEIQVKLGLSGDTVRPRVKELMGEMPGYNVVRIKIKLIDKLAEGGGLKLVPATRKTESKRDAEILVAI